MVLDLGGIGKGLAGDLVVDALVTAGATSVCLSLGGDVRVAGPGPHDDAAWRVPVEDPRTDAVAFEFDLVDEAIAQSTTLVRQWRDARGVPVHHLVDARSGRPASTDVVGAVVTAQRGWQADVLAKTAVLAGTDDAITTLAGAAADGWLFLADGTVRTTPAVADTVVGGRCA